MMRPSRFDNEYAEDLAKADAKEALLLIAKDHAVILAVTNALAEYDSHAGIRGWAGPSRTQAVRTALSDALAAD